MGRHCVGKYSNICVVGCEVKFMQESGVTRLWEVARFKKLRSSTSSQPDKNLYVCVYVVYLYVQYDVEFTCSISHCIK